MGDGGWGGHKLKQIRNVWRLPWRRGSSHKLKKETNWIDLLKACWPGGSITGAPKLRSCQRLFELEECERGPYCGSFLKLDWNGEFDSNILIRSFLIKDKKINIYAGCGIVIDSNPEEETNELKWKLLPLIDSLKWLKH